MLDDVFYCSTCELEVDPDRDSERAIPSMKCPIDGTRLFRLSKKFKPGVMVDGRYTLQKPLGRGGMGVVFLARQHAMDRDVAIKFISNQAALSPENMRRFFREAKACAIVNHPGVITIYDFGQTNDGTPFMVMELLRGSPLKELIESQAPFEPMRAACIALEIAEALTATHALGILHRDLKPGNIFLVRDAHGAERVKVLDFGLAKSIEDGSKEQLTITATGNLIGTPVYMSPEQFLGEKLSASADLYGVGCVLYEMLSGRPPFEHSSIFGLMLAHLENEPCPFSQLKPTAIEVPNELEAVCLSLLKKKPGARPESVLVVARRLRELLVGEGIVGVKPNPPPAPASGSREAQHADTAAVETEIFERVKKRADADFRPALVGRVSARRFLQETLQSCFKHRRGSLLLLEGPGGVGKSKLLEWFRSHAQRQHARVATGHHSERHIGPLGVVHDVLEIFYGRSAPKAERRQRLQGGDR